MIFRYELWVRVIEMVPRFLPFFWNPLSNSAAACSGRSSDSKGFRFRGQKSTDSSGVEGGIPDRLGEFACLIGGPFLTYRGCFPDRLGLS